MLIPDSVRDSERALKISIAGFPRLMPCKAAPGAEIGVNV
jgi:hypothetical protein